MQVNPNNNVQVGNLPVDFSKDKFNQMTKDAGVIPLDNNDPKDWAAMGKRVGDTGQVTDDDMSKLKAFSTAAATGKTSYKNSLWDTIKDPKATKEQKDVARAKLADVNCYMWGYSSLTEALKGATAKAAVAAVVGASFGPIGVLAAYQTWANLKNDELKEVADGMQGMADGTASFIYHGNKATQYHQEALWQCLNQMHDGAIASAKAGKPEVVAGQYYELTSQQEISKFVESAKAGNPVYLNLDPTRITPPPKGKSVNYDDGPDKLRSMLQLMNGGCALSTFPCEKLLGDAADLMHRKGLQTGNKFLLSGMNANEGSGENIDRGYVLEGPAAHRKGQDFIRDVKNSFANPSMGDRYGQENLDGFLQDTVTMGLRGISALVDASSKNGPSPAGTELPTCKTYDELAAYSKERGFNLDDLIDTSHADAKSQINGMLAEGGKPVALSTQGKQMVLDLMTKVNDRVNSAENKSKFDAYQPPSDAVAGTATVTLADKGTERQATVLQTIRDAEKFIYLPTFVITRPIAAALAAKQKEMDEAGKPFDIRLVADSGIYPDGSTPNKTGVMLLEDEGLKPRWTLLPRSGGHDRKIHAKDVLTDKSEWFGSTNLSGKGMRENWEQSGVVNFDPKDKELMADRDKAQGLFNELWDHMSFECNTIDLATYRCDHGKYPYHGRDRDSQIDYLRGKVVDELIANLEDYEKQSGAFVSQKVDKSPKIQARIAELTKSGMDEGNARLVSVAEDMGKDNFYKTLGQLPSRKKLEAMLPPQPAKPKAAGE